MKKSEKLIKIEQELGSIVFDLFLQYAQGLITEEQVKDLMFKQTKEQINTNRLSFYFGLTD